MNLKEIQDNLKKRKQEIIKENSKSNEKTITVNTINWSINYDGLNDFMQGYGITLEALKYNASPLLDFFNSTISNMSHENLIAYLEDKYGQKLNPLPLVESEEKPLVLTHPEDSNLIPLLSTNAGDHQIAIYEKGITFIKTKDKSITVWMD